MYTNDYYYNSNLFFKWQKYESRKKHLWSKEPAFRFRLKQYIDAHENHAPQPERAEPLFHLWSSEAQLVAVDIAARKFYYYISNTVMRDIVSLADEIIKDFRNGLTIQEICMKHRLSKRQVFRVLQISGRRDQLDEVVLGMRNSGKSISDISDETGLCYETVRKITKSKESARNYKRISLEEGALIESMKLLGISIYETAKLLGRPVSTVYYYLKRGMKFYIGY